MHITLKTLLISVMNATTILTYIDQWLHWYNLEYSPNNPPPPPPNICENTSSYPPEYNMIITFRDIEKLKIYLFSPP